MAEEARVKVSLMEKFLFSYRSYQRARWDEKSSLDYAHEQGLVEGKAAGIIEGKAEGLQQRQIEIARQLKAEGIAAEIIERATGLSAEEIDK